MGARCRFHSRSHRPARPIPATPRSVRLAAGGLALGLAACGPIVQLGGPSGPPPAQHLLTAPSLPPAADRGALDPARSVTLLTATAPAMLQTTRIPVRVGPTEVRYLVGHGWTEPPARLFMQLLDARLVADGVPVIDRRVSGRSAARVLGGELVEFGVDATGDPRVRIRFEATLAGPEGIRRQGFARDLPIDRIEGPDAAAALSAASAAVAADISRWVAAAAPRRD